jgi:putative inorganic carbon (hco3(-)) transporter
MRKISFILLWLFVFVMPWDYCVWFGEPIGSLGRVAGLLALGSGMVAVLLSGRMRRFSGFHAAVGLFFVLVCCSMAWTYDTEATARSIRTYVQVICTVWLIWEFAPDTEHQELLMLGYVLGAGIASCLVVRNLAGAGNTQGIMHPRFSAEGWDPNDLALALVIAIPLAAWLSNRIRSRVAAWACRGYLLVGPLAALLTGSRGGLVALAVAALAVPLLFTRTGLTTKLCAGVLLMGIALAALSFVPGPVWSRLGTLPSEIVSGDLRQRATIWEYGLRTLADHPVLGVGAGAFKQAAGASYTAHNTFLAVLVEMGFLGFGVFVVVVGFPLVRIWRGQAGQRYLWLVTLACWAAGASGLGWQERRITWFVLGLALASAMAHSHQSSALPLEPEMSNP